MELSTDIWAGALMRRAQLAGAFATVVRKGDERGGAVMIKTYNPRTRQARLYARALGGDGEALWMQPRPDDTEAELDAYVERAARIDPDLWLIEIEDGEGRHFLTERVEGG